jgi:outer membrane protein TolC
LRAHEWEIRALEEEAALSGWAAWEGAGAGVEAERDGAWAVGPSVSVPVPVFDTGGVVRAKVTAARAAARHELLENQRRVVEEVRTAHAALVSASGALARVREDLLPRRRAMRAMAEAAYLVGEGDVRSVLMAEHDLRVADTRAVELEKEAWTARVRLERAAGGPGAAEGVAEGAGASAWNQRDAARVDDSTR